MATSTQAAAAAAAAADDSAARTFSQVVFVDIPHAYPLSTPIRCCYTLAAPFQPNTRDWVGIFKVGWSTTKDYHTFVWVEPSLDVVGPQSVTRHADFKDYYLPKDEIEFYQFCYVDSSGQVRGASTPFCFGSQVEQSMESSPDDDLLVITTQEQVEQSVREKTELQKELDQIREEKEALRSALQKEQQEAASLKGQNEEKDREVSQLAKELDHIKAQNEHLNGTLQEQLKEADRLKEEMLAQMTQQMEIQEQNAAEQKTVNADAASRQNEEKYDRAVAKINLLKDEREDLRGKVDVQSVEIAMLNSKLREGERELSKMTDSIQLLQVDLQSSEKEKERLSVELQKLQSLTQNMDAMQREIQELRRRLAQQEALQNCPDDDLRGQCQTLASQLQEAQAKLAAEKEESKTTKRQVEYLNTELSDIKGQLESLAATCEQAERRSGKLELQLREALEAIADKDGVIEEKERLVTLVNQEKEELVRENQSLSADIEGLRRAYTGLQVDPPADSPPTQPDTTSTTDQQQETPEQAENLYENIENVADPDPEEELSLVCRHCQESFPFITRRELEQHEQSHRVCPFCTLICDNMEQSVFEDHVYSHEL